MSLVSKKWVSGLQVGAIMSAYAAQASIGRLRFRDRDERLRYFTKNVSKWCARCLDAMRVEVSVHGYKPELFENKNYLMVGNHLSYVDILVLSTVRPAVFVTSVDLGETKFLGPMAELGGSIFVERRNRAQISRDLGVMRDTLRAGHNVVIFPEGTSSNGAGVLPFKKSLLMAAVDAQKDVLPIVFKYTEIDGQPINESNRDRICWYGDMSFGPHFLDILGTRQLKVELHFLEPIPVTSETTRHGLAEEAHARISAVYGRPFEKDRLEMNT
jgi:lyso-ornithine lipid O-acyltransferase